MTIHQVSWMLINQMIIKPVLPIKSERINKQYLLKCDSDQKISDRFKPGNWFWYSKHFYSILVKKFPHKQLLDEKWQFDKFVSFVPPPNKYFIVSKKTKADCTKLNTWISLSIHWDADWGLHESSVWCNGQKLHTFISISSIGSTKLTIGDLALFILFVHFKTFLLNYTIRSFVKIGI